MGRRINRDGERCFMTTFVMYLNIHHRGINLCDIMGRRFDLSGKESLKPRATDFRHGRKLTDAYMTIFKILCSERQEKIAELIHFNSPNGPYDNMCV